MVANITWTGAAGDGNFNNPANWSPAQVPGAGDTVTIDPTVATAIAVSNDSVGSLTIDNLVTLNIADNTSLTIGIISGGGTGFANAGTLMLNSVGDHTALVVAAPTLSLTGTGTVLLSNNIQNYIQAGTAGNELDNVSNLIEGSGQIGGTDLAFVNGAAGVVDADQSVSLVLNTGTSTTLNSGLLESTSTGGLYLQSVVNNGTVGKVTASGGNVYLQGGDIQGGTISTSGGGALVDANGGTLDGSTHTVTNTGTVIVNDNEALNLLGTITNKGSILLNSVGDNTVLVIGSSTAASTVTLTGGGKIVLSNNNQNAIDGGFAGDTLLNLNNTISGGGAFTSSITLVNDATIDANAVNFALNLDTAAAVVNDGVLEATLATGAGLAIDTAVNSSGGGTILAASGNVYLQNGSLQGGKIETSGGGEVIETNTGTLDGSAHALTNLGTVYIQDNHIVNLLGAIVNDGTIALGSGGDGTFLEAASATVSLTGTGTISLSNNVQNYIFGSVATNELDNVTNVIEGAGQIGSENGLTLVNGAAGVIDGNLFAGLTLNVGPVAVANSGLIEASGTGGLTIYNSTVNDSTGGTILADTAIVDLNSGTIVGGVIAASGAGSVVAIGGTNLLNGTAQAVTITGTVAIHDNQLLQIEGNITNDSSILLNSIGDGTDLEIVSATLTLNGGGKVVLSDNSNSANYIYGAVAADVLDNTNNTIEGAGQVGDGQLTLINGTAGTISATGTANQLILNTGTIAVANSGLIEATGSAGLVVQNTTINNGTLGIISAADGNVYLSGAYIEGGTLSSSGTGSFLEQSNSTLDGSTHTVINDATVTVHDNQQLYLLGTITNAGTIALASVGDGTNLAIGPVAAAGTVTLTGGGQVTLSASNANYIYAAFDGSTLINLNNTISGSGTLGYNDLFVTNDAVIDANAAAALVIDPGETLTNNDLIEATGTGGLFVYNTTISNGNSGTILASGGGVTLSGADILGGSLTGITGFAVTSTSILDGSTYSLVNDTTITLHDNQLLYLLGTLTNAGTLSLASTGDGTDLQIGYNGVVGTVTFTGGGQVALSNTNANYIYANATGDTLINLNNTISGAGTVGYNGLFITNDSVIDANATTALTIDPSEVFTNNELIEATNTGGLVIYNTAISNGTLGTIAAAGGVVTLNGATIEGGSLTGTSGFVDNSSATLDGTANAIDNTSTLTLNDNERLYLLGTIDNVGTLALASGGDSTDLLIGPNTTPGTVILTGGGQLALSNNTQNYVYAYTTGDTLINLNNTITGAGTLGYNGLLFTNDSVIDANASNALTIDPSEIVTNNDLIESTGTGGLTILNTTISNGAAGTITAAAGNITVSGATLEGGLVTSAGTYAVYFTAGAALGGATGTTTNAGNILLEDNQVGYLYGAINNKGTITLDSGGDTTRFILETPTVTLSGTGSLVLSNNTHNYVYGATVTDVFDNASNVIEGAGDFGDEQMTLVNGGIIDADDSNTLTINLGSTGTNLATGEWLGTGSGGLSIANGTYTNAGLIEADDGSNVSFQSSAVLSNSANGTLTGGTYGAISAGDGATLSITGGAVSVDAANIILSGAESSIDFGGTAIDSSLGSIAAGGKLNVLGARNFTVVANGGTLADSGVVTLGGGTFTATSLALAAGGTVAGFGTVAGPVSGGGTISASGGTLLFSGAVSGEGKITAASGATVDFTTGGALPASISGAGTLRLDGAAYTISNAALTIAAVKVDAGAGLSGNGTLTGALANAGIVTVSSGTLLLDGAVSGAGSFSAASGAVLDLAGGGTLSGGIGGAGTLVIGGATTLETGATLNATAVIETANLTLASVSMTNAASDSFTITAASGKTVTLSRSGTGSFTNAGSLLANGAGTAQISAQFVETGNASVTAGTLLIAGALSGNGTLVAGAGAVLDIKGGGSFGGAIAGAGTVDIAGSTTLTAGANVSAANLIETANMLLNGVSISNASGNAITLTAASGVSIGLHDTGTGGTFTNAGSLVANGAGTADLAVAFIDNGTASATAGTLLINAGLHGTGTLSAGTGAVVDLNSTASFGGALTGAGTIEISTTAVTLTAGASLSVANLVETSNLTLASVSLTNTAADSFTITAASGKTVTLAGSGTGSFTNAGSLLANGAGTATISAPFLDTGTANVTAGTLLISGALSGNGSLDAGSGAVLDLSGGGSFAGALSGAGTIEFSNSIATLTTGASLSATNVTQTSSLVLNSVAITNGAGDVFSLTAASGATLRLLSSGTGSSFTNAGSLTANGAGTADISAPFVNSGVVSTATGSLTFIGSVSNSGTIDTSGLTTIDTKVGGTGTLDVGTTGTLSLLLGAGSGQVVDFLGTTGILDLTKPLDFVGTISGFGGSDQIDLINTAETSYSYANNVLTVKDGTSTVASLNFTGTSNSFSLTSDNHGGTLITFG
jgi:hypothetical protein